MKLTTLQNIVAYIIQVSDSCPVSFMTAVSRIYYVPAWAGRPDRYSAHIKESLRSDRELSHDIHNLLEDFKMQAEPWQRQLILEDLVKLLRLSNTFSSAAAGFNRLSFAKHTQSSYGWKHADSLATVECQSCNTRSVFRLAMWKIVNTPLKLYRIPGLRFQHSMENGVGLAISRNRICGRMIYGTPACDCHGREAIEIV